MFGMSIFVSRPALRWLVPVAVTVAVVGGGAAARTIAASAEPSLPDRSAAQLLVDLQTANLSGLSGTVRTSADLGLPELPDNVGPGAPDLTGLITGSRTLRVWYSGPDKMRVALLGTLGESDIIRNGRDMWQWDSRSQQAVHRQLPADGAEPQKPGNPNLPKSPQEAADLALKAVDPTTVVSTGTNARVAGRTASVGNVPIGICAGVTYLIAVPLIWWCHRRSGLPLVGLPRGPGHAVPPPGPRGT